MAEAEIETNSNKVKVFDFLKSEEIKLVEWIKAKEPQFISDIQAAAKFTTAAIAWQKSPTGVTVEAFINANMKNAPKWEAEATKIATALLTDLLAVKSVASIQGIALRLGAELLQLFDGKKLPQGIDGYIAEFQQIFI